MTREPLLTTGALTALGAALIALLVAFGLPLTDDQQAAVLGVLAAVVPLAVAFSARSQVTPIAEPAMPDGRPAVLIPAASLVNLDERDERLLPRDGGVVTLGAVMIVALLILLGVVLLLLGIGVNVR